MNKKFKKLIKNPKLFFTDLMLNQSLNAQIASSEKYDCCYSYEIIVFCDQTVQYIDRCIDSIYSQKVNLNKNITIKVLDFGLDLEQKDIIQSLSIGDLQILDMEVIDVESFLLSIKNEYALFVWGDDCLDINFISNIDRLINSNDAESLGIIYTQPLQGKSHLTIGKEYHPLRQMHKNLPEIGCSHKILIGESIYGTVIPRV